MPTSRKSGHSQNPSSFNSSGSAKWTKNIRALPSSSESNDYLKTDYIEVNLNNSRKLIENLNQLSENTKKCVTLSGEINERLLVLNNVQATLQWLDDI